MSSKTSALINIILFDFIDAQIWTGPYKSSRISANIKRKWIINGLTIHDLTGLKFAK